MTAAGEIALWTGMLLAVWALVAGTVGGATAHSALVRSALRTFAAIAALLLLAAAGVMAPLARQDYALAYAAAVSSHDLPTRYAVAALWSAPAGAALLLAIPLAAGAAITLAGAPTRGRTRGTVAAGVLLLALLAPLCALNLLYARLDWVPSDGGGLPPELQSLALLVHAPVAAVAWSLVVAYALAAAIEPRAPSRRVRVVGIVAWVLAGLSVLAAMRWAYRDATWVERWPARPLHDGSLIAWVMTGGAIATTSAASTRIRRLTTPLTLLAGAAAIAAAAVWPLGLVESAAALWRGRALAASAATLGVVLIVAWRAARATPPLAPSRAPRPLRLAGLVLGVVGVVLVAAALVGVRSRVEHDVDLPDGRAVELRDPSGVRWRLVGQGVSRYQAENRDVSELAVELTRDGHAAGLLTAERWQALDLKGGLRGEAVSTVGVRAGVRADLTLVLLESREGGARARIGFEPRGSWTWLGGALVLLGGLLALL